MAEIFAVGTSPTDTIVISTSYVAENTVVVINI